MLEPEGRQPLLDALRPPPGFVLDRAVGTSYSLDLLALLTAPLAFALFDRVTDDGDALDVDPVALLEPFRSLPGLESKVMLAGTDFYLDILNLDSMSLGFSKPGLLILVVLKFTIIGNFCNGRHGIGGNLDKIESQLLGLS